MAAASRWHGGNRTDTPSVGAMVRPFGSSERGGQSHFYDFDRRWLLNEIASDYRAYRKSMDRGAPDLVLIGRIDARLLVGLQFALLSHQEEADLRRQYLAAWAMEA